MQQSLRVHQIAPSYGSQLLRLLAPRRATRKGWQRVAPAGWDVLRPGHSLETAMSNCAAASSTGSGEQDVAGGLVSQMSVEELSDRMVDDEWVSSSQLLDVREDWEHETSFLPHFALRPFSRFPSWGPSAAAKLDPERETVVLCHHGIRSYSVAQFLADQGFKRVFNVSGGIDAYSRIVDPSVPRY